MRWDGQIVVSAGTVGADPIASPGSVSARQLLQTRAKITQHSDLAFPRRILLGLSSTGTETVTVSLYAADDSTMPGPNADWTSALLSARRFFLVASGVVLTNGNIAEISTIVPPGGTFYVRVTGDTLTGSGVILLALADTLDAAAPPPPPFVPTDISGLVRWLDADTVVLDGSGFVQTQTNKVVSAYFGNPTQTTPSERPTLTAVNPAFNNQPTVDYAATSSQWLQETIVGGPSACTSFIVHSIISKTPSNNRGSWRSGTDAANFYTLTNGRIFDDTGSTTRKNWIPPDALAVKHCFSVMSKSGTWTAKINGAVSYTQASNTVGWATDQRIGRNTVGTAYDGSMACWLIYDHELTAPELSSIHTWLNTRYALTLPT